jgi:rhodanese-related sulfurtransferase
MPKTVDDLVAEARSIIDRITPEEAHDELADGALLIDVRTSEQRAEHGDIAGAVPIGLNVLEWRLDPSGEWRISQATRHDVRVIVFCQEGYSSSLAAARLQSLGLHRATDVIGGFAAWRDAGLPIDRPIRGDGEPSPPASGA